jgi:hypothetical protein
MRFKVARAFILSSLLLLSACSVFSGAPSYVASANDTAAVESIELAFANGDGTGAFVSAIDPSNNSAMAGQRFRLRVLFDSGNRAVVIQDGTIPLIVGQRVTVSFGTVRPTDRVDIPHLAPIAPF